MSTPGKKTTGGSASVDFVLRTALERACGNKRPIRPKLVDDTLLGDDSDDSDFEIDKQLKLDSNSDTGSGTGSDSSSDSHTDSTSRTGGDESESGSDSDEVSSKQSSLRDTLKKLNEESFQPPKKKPVKRKLAKTPHSAKTNAKKPKLSSKPTKKPATATSAKSPPKKGKKAPKESVKKTDRERRKSDNYSGSVTHRIHEAVGSIGDIRKDIDLKRKICSVCLGEKSDSSNEIVECDSCLVTVHEGCYNVADNSSVSSGSGSSSSTEPWFCDFCKQPEGRAQCVLCPLPDGLLKVTLEGQFVHVICALYIPKVSFGHDGKPNFFNFPYSKWGRKPCSLCSNFRFAHTGATVNCDAGMCRANVHITCAQKLGLLSYPNSHADGTEEAADPHFASCRAHVPKEQAKSRARLFQVLQEQVRIKREKKLFANLTHGEQLAQSRIMDKLQSVRIKASDRSGSVIVLDTGFVIGTPQGLDSLPKARNLSTCASSVLRFLHKADAQGEDMTSLELEHQHNSVIANVTKRWNVLPSLTVEFAAYYYDREARIDRMSRECKRIVRENHKLNDQQIALSSALETESLNQMDITDESRVLDSSINKLKTILKILSPANSNLNNIQGLSPRNKQTRRSPSHASQGTPSSASKSKNKAHLPLPLYAICALCSKSDYQHLITKCDHCQKHYHLACLDPPLTRMPKRSRLCGWMCSDCCDEESEHSDSVAVDTEAPRALRGRTNIKRPPKYRDFSEDSDPDFAVKKEKSSPGSPPIRTPPTKPIHLLKDLHIKVEPVSTLNGSLLRNSSRKSPASTPSPQAPRPKLGKAEKLSPVMNNLSGSKGTQSQPKTTPVQPNRTEVPGPKSKAKPSPPSASATMKTKLSSPPVSTTVKTKPSPSSASVSSAMKTEIPSPIPSQRPRRSSGQSSSSSVTPVSANPSPRNSRSMPQAQDVSGSKDLKIILSSVKMEGAGKNGMSSGPPSGNTDTLPSPVEKKTVPRKRKTKEKDFFGSLNISGQMAAALNYTGSSGSSTLTARCSACAKMENKKNLVQCDECSEEFHFTCVDPFVPYNPKRRGYSWVCAKCTAAEDAESSLPQMNGAAVNH